MADRGHRPVRFTEDIEVRLPTLDEASFLRISSTVPVIEVRRTAFDEEGVAVEGAVNVLAAYRWRLTYEWHADDEPPEEEPR